MNFLNTLGILGALNLLVENPLFRASKGAAPMPVPEVKPASFSFSQPLPDKYSLQRETEIAVTSPKLATTLPSLEQESPDLESWRRIYKSLYSTTPEPQPMEIGGGGGETPPSLGDFSNLTPSFTSPAYWGGFTPSYAQKTGSFWGDLSKSLGVALSDMKSMKDFISIGAMLGMPFGPALSVLGVLGLSEKSSLNPVNNPAVRSALNEIFSQSKEAKSIFGTQKAFEGFLGGLFGYGSALKGVKEATNLKSYFETLLGYMPTKVQFETMRTNAMDTVRGLGMALANFRDFTTYRDFVNNSRKFGWLETYPTFHDYATLTDIATTLGLSPKSIAPAYVFGFFDRFTALELTDPALAHTIAREALVESNRHYAREMTQEAINNYRDTVKNNPQMEEEAFKEFAQAVLDAYAKEREANNRNMSILDLTDVSLSATTSSAASESKGISEGFSGEPADFSDIAEAFGGLDKDTEAASGYGDIY